MNNVIILNRTASISRSSVECDIHLKGITGMRNTYSPSYNEGNSFSLLFISFVTLELFNYIFCFISVFCYRCHNIVWNKFTALIPTNHIHYPYKQKDINMFQSNYMDKRNAINFYNFIRYM